jgi:ComEC/Rec2-related protein
MGQSAQPATKRPFAPLVVALAAGILAGRFSELPLVWLYGFSVALALAALASSLARPWLLLPLLFLVGWVNLATREAILSPIDLRKVMGDRVALVTLRGRLDTAPIETVCLWDGSPPVSSHAVLKTEAIQPSKEAWQPVSGRVAVNTPGSLSPEFSTGRKVEVTGVLRQPRTPSVEGQFDYAQYLRWRGVYHQLRTKDTNDWRLAAPTAALARPPLPERFFAWATNTLARGLPAFEEPAEEKARDLLWSMSLGWKTALDDTVAEPFMRTGTIHIFAVSGLHIALISGVLLAVLRTLRVPRVACGWVAIPLLWFYTAVIGWQASGVRSAIMTTVLIVGWSLRRPGNLLNSLAAAAFIVLVWDPRQLFQASFQLSFFVVLSIALFLPPLEKVVTRMLAPDPFLPAELVPRWRRWLGRPLRWVLLSFATSLAASLGSLPLIAAYFNMVTPVSLLANLLIVPMSSLALMGGLGGLVFGAWLPPVTELFNWSAWLWMKWTVAICEWFSRLPGGSFNVRAPTLWECAVYYAILAGLMSGWLLAPSRRVWSAVGAGLLALSAGVWQVAKPSQTTLSVLAMSRGSALYLDAPGRAGDLLIDCGDTGDVRFVLEPLLKARGVNRLPHVLLTHGDARHVNGWSNLAAASPPKRVYTSYARSRSPNYRRVTAALQNDPERWVQIERGDTVARWTVLHPPRESRFPREDDKAVVLRGESHGIRVLLLSDLGKAGQAELVAASKDLRADVVVTGLPSEGEPLTEDLLAAVRARLIVVNDASFPSSARLPSRVRDRLAAAGAPVFCTSDGEPGACALKFSARGWELLVDGSRRYSGQARLAH